MSAIITSVVSSLITAGIIKYSPEISQQIDQVTSKDLEDRIREKNNERWVSREPLFNVQKEYKYNDGSILPETDIIPSNLKITHI